MKNFKKVFGNAGQSILEAKKPHKHDANLRKNSSLYFQIGLILCLIGTYTLFEMQFQTQVFVNEIIESNDLATIDIAPTFLEEEIKSEVLEIKNDRSVELIDIYEEIEDDKKSIETSVVTPDEKTPETKPFNLNSLPVEPDLDEDDIFIPFSKIENAPIYPGCEKYDTNDKRKKCMSEEIAKLINKKFNIDIAAEYGLSGVQQIYTQFTIDKSGNIIDIKARAPHIALEKEAQRIISKLPQMKPGYQRDVPVGVIYTLPIRFQVQ